VVSATDTLESSSISHCSMPGTDTDPFSMFMLNIYSACLQLPPSLSKQQRACWHQVAQSHGLHSASQVRRPLKRPANSNTRGIYNDSDRRGLLTAIGLAGTFCLLAASSTFGKQQCSTVAMHAHEQVGLEDIRIPFFSRGRSAC
jgi:hypothetical protein